MKRQEKRCLSSTPASAANRHIPPAANTSNIFFISAKEYIPNARVTASAKKAAAKRLRTIRTGSRITPRSGGTNAAS